MSDAHTRSLARHAGDDPSVADRLIAERLRAGGRDPRVDPRDGDEVEERAGRRTQHRREVERTWPRALESEVVALAWTALRDPLDSRRTAWLPAGALVACMRPVGDWIELTVSTAPGVWADYRALRDGSVDEPSTIAAPEGTPVLEVEWDRTRDYVRGERSSGRVSIETWRRWARGGRVLRLGG